jgi:hypothetical protein
MQSPRRTFLVHGVQAATTVAIARVTAPTLVAGAASLLSGCAEIAGEQQIDTYFLLKPTSSGVFGGWTEIALDQAPEPGDSAVLERASMTAPAGMKDLTFITSIEGAAVDPASGSLVPLVRGDDFPKNDTIGFFEILYPGNIGRFFKGGTTIRIEWNGRVATNAGIPAEGVRIDALVTVDVAADGAS